MTGGVTNAGCIENFDRDVDMEQWKAAFFEYAQDPLSAWPDQRQLQANKFEHCMRSIGDSQGLTLQGVVEWLVDLAEKRMAHRPLTLFVISCGSSGSHWLEAMISNLGQFVPCGEVYLPNARLREMEIWPVEERSAFLDCIHLAHAKFGSIAPPSARLINIAHFAGWRMIDLMGMPIKTVLLLRNPVDVVLSRTFRKPEYRDSIQSGASDRDYLDRNIGYVRRFHIRSQAHKVDLTVRYEDLRSHPIETLKTLLSELDVCPEPIILEHVVRDFSMEQQLARGSVRKTNAYRGPSVAIPDEFIAMARSELEDVCRAYNYIEC